MRRSETCVDDHAIAIAQGLFVRRRIARSFPVPRLSGDSTVSHRLCLLTQLISPTPSRNSELWVRGLVGAGMCSVRCSLQTCLLRLLAMSTEQGVDCEASNASRASSKMAMMRPRAVVAIIRMYNHTAGVLLGVCLWQDGGLWLFCGCRTVTSVFHKNAPKAPDQ